MRTAIWTLCTLLLLAPVAARAQPTGTTTTATDSLGLTKADFADLAFMRKEKQDDGSFKWVFMNKTTFDTFFNRKRCECDEEVQVRVTLLPASRKKIATKTGKVNLRAGDNTCVCQTAMCPAVSTCPEEFTKYQDLSGLANGNLDFTFKVRDLFASGRTATTDTAAMCDRDDNQNLWLWIDGPDSDSSSDITDDSVQIKLDGVPPPSPTGLSVVGGEEALQVSWNEIAHLPDMQGYQVLCSRGGNAAPFANPPSARYETSSSCTVTSSTGDSGADGGTSDAGTTSATGALVTAAGETTQESFALVMPGQRGAPPPALAKLDPHFVCSDLLTGTTQTRLYQLENGVPYVVGVVAIDLRGNPSKLTEVVLQTPVQTRDFYSGYRKDGGAAEGGYCALVPHSGDLRAARTTWALLGLGLLVLGVRRRRRTR